MINYKLSDNEKKDLLRYTKLKLDRIAKDCSHYDNDRKAMFIMLLVQYLAADEAGVDFIDGGKAYISNKDELRVYCRGNEGLCLFVRSLCIMRNDICFAYCLPGTINAISSFFSRPEMVELCNMIGIKISTSMMNVFFNTEAEDNPFKTAADTMGN